MKTANYKVRLSTRYKSLPVIYTEHNLYKILDRIDELREQKYDNWMDTDEVYSIWVAHPFKVTNIIFDKDGNLTDLELTEF